MALPIGRAWHVRLCLVNFKVLIRSSILNRCAVHSASLLRNVDTPTSPPSAELNHPEQPKPVTKAERISKAMVAYLQRATAHDNMIKDQIAEYEIGKRHLANIMGEDPDSFSQEDVDRAVEYLLPSGLFEKKARPLMKHPYEVFPQKKLAQFGADGRPFHFLFYTGKPNYYQLMYDATWKYEALKTEEDRLVKKGLLSTIEHKKLSLYGSEWVVHDTLQTMLVEKFGPQDHTRFALLMERLANHPLSFMEEEFIMKYRRKLTAQSLTQAVPKPLVDDEGREFMTAKGLRKSSTAEVTVWIKGSGKLTINGQDLEYFSRLSDYEQIMFPLQFLDMIGKVDVVATVSGGGPTGQAGAIRLALAKALTSFVEASTVEKMRLAGLLQVDFRRRERKKPGQVKARKKNTWKKR
ncbi:28S ribosomal protein S9, mitochondrial-like [Gigantopelta aegis]|uniref:28S ribosomal protein S9, mitochondrial-like n=1 Tax=Gigantopelta aegis TaxID=1735272 RepID=UPI001B889492|nr:28S ribosomal protein S9, mitochondrial-like [Gigantopelta aegis]